ncbi:MAG: alpha/beta hydrolase domain-containing protein [Chloroflexi bacterium]|nr:alpha/beta hydrolase domain-containing protein [Chloroflexota bacterium]MDA1145334.1 alpha/beta hydrolase domain-containing protein [Chloroflexota bacterium]
MPVVDFEITSRRPFAEGVSFGEVGAYEQIDARVTFAVDPTAEVNAAIVDLALAPRDAEGCVRFTSDLSLLAPANGGAGNGRLLVDVVNRGNPRALGAFNRADAGGDPAGDGFLMRRGWSVASIGWQWDVPAGGGLLGLQAPHAMIDGREIRGQIAVEIRPHVEERTRLLANRIHIPYLAADLEQPDAALLVRDWEDGPASELPRSSWRFAREVDGGGVEPSREHVYLESGFVPGKIYELVFETEGAPVVGCGLLALREIASFLRGSSTPSGAGPEDVGSPGGASLNPTGGFERVYGYGISQTGRMLRHLLYLALNVAEDGSAAYDGLLPHVAGGRRGEFNHRFAQPSQQSLPGFGHQFPFSDDPTVDPYSERTEGLLDRLRSESPEALPKVIYTNSGAEYWRGDGSLAHIDPAGDEDIELPEEVRSYSFAGAQHVPGTMPPDSAAGGDGARPRYARNTVDYRPLLRAALINLDAWVSQRIEPPPSRYPRIADGTAVTRAEALASLWAVPGLERPDPERLWVIRTTDLGSDAAEGIGRYPVVEGDAYPALVSALDANGNERAGVRLPDVTVPLATHLPWNLRDPDSGAPEQIVPMIGSSHYFGTTRLTREAVSDPRRSLGERYADRADYLAQVEAAARALASDRYVLESDVATLVADAAVRWDWATRTT